MKILQVVDSLNIGGAEKMCVQLANLMYRNGHEVTVLYFIEFEQNLSRLLQEGVKIKHIPRQLRNPMFYKRVANFCQSYDIIHIHLRSSAKVMFIASLFLTKKKSMIFHDHTGSAKLFYETSRGIILKKAIQKFKYVAVYEDLRIRTVEKYKLSIEDTSVISNFVERRSHLKIKRYDFDINNLSILVIGNIKPQKNQLFLIELAKIFIDKGIQCFRFHLVGKVQDIAYHQQYLMELKKNNLQDHFKEYANYNDFSEIDLSVNFALMPSLDESGPLVNIEYILMQLPFLSHGVGNISLTLAKVLPDIILDHLDAKIWADKILSNKGLSDAIAQYDQVYNYYFSEEIAYSKWLACYSFFND